jgi:hypothetical protein
MAIIVATLLLFLAGPFVLWPLIRTPDEIEEAPSAGLSGKRGGGKP